MVNDATEELKLRPTYNLQRSPRGPRRRAVACTVLQLRTEILRFGDQTNFVKDVLYILNQREFRRPFRLGVFSSLSIRLQLTSLTTKYLTTS